MDISLHLLIDGNHFLYKNVFILNKTRTLYTDLPFLLEKEIKKFKKMAFWNQKWISVDSRNSWRKKIYPNYKSNRPLDENIDWEWVWNTFNEFLNQLDDFVVLKEETLEGDDCLSILIEELNSIGGSTVLVSSDKDFLQLIKSKKNSINFMYSDISNKEKLYTPKDALTILNILKNNNKDIFSGDDWESAENVKKAMTKLYFETKYVEEIDWKEELIRKIIEGDKGDNVLSVFEEKQQLKKGGERSVGIGKSSSKKIWNLYMEKGGGNFEPLSNESIFLLSSCIKEIKNTDDENIENIVEKIKLNKTLIHLEQNNFPKDKVEKIKNKINLFIKNDITNFS